MIYVHVPFCGSFCTYCDFYSEIVGGAGSKGSVASGAAGSGAAGSASRNAASGAAGSGAAGSASRNAASGAAGSAGRVRAYVDGVISEIYRRRDEIAATLQTNTLYIGGGTPSVLPLDELSRIVKALEAVGARDFDEFTVEVNPEDIVGKGEPYARGLRSLGVNRVSMGVQSLDDGILRWMNRRHDAARALEAFRILRRAGFDNISVDVIFGISHLSDETLALTLRGLLGGAPGSDRPEHISAYQLSVEDGSALGRMVRQGRYTEASDEQCAGQYELICRTLAAAGHHHYEISNWALPGREARHNSAYWTGQPYVGLGPGAHSFTGASGGDARMFTGSNLSSGAPGKAAATRSWNSKTLSGWTSEAEHLTPEDLRTERIMLGLRTDRGIPLTELHLPASPSLADAASLSAGTSLPDGLEYVPGTLPGAIPGGAPRIRIPENRWFVSDDIISSLI